MAEPASEPGLEAAPQPTLAPALGPGSRFEGLVVLRGPGRIDGDVRGQIVASDQLWIGEAARIDASIDASEVVIAGRVTGEVRARQRIELLAGARVTGTLTAPKVRCADGAHLDGSLRTGAPEPP